MIHSNLSIEAPLQNLFGLNSVEELEIVFSDCLECHHHLSNTAASLFNGVSESNMLFARCGNGVLGVLSDWDIGLERNDPSGSHPSIRSPRHCARTFPFMARDLLVNPPPLHLHRHHLESFFYILVWVVIHYDFERRRKHRTPAELQCWNDKNATDNAKGYFIYSPLKRDHIFRHIRKEFHGLRDKWLLPLWRLFRDAQVSLDDHRGDPGYDIATYGGRITFDTVMAVINRGRRHFRRTSMCAPLDIHGV
ncbi:hypothetical protein Hypma_003575 [Hypsizygus marmoreus]|uniref:Fungal-type protein kinase domain-containing protein n=1 Tax=Hypsizygus marmoreus TaxID=39966 RepID=A0A369J4A7_HYPMA|nr:hypothetical protein Hypma_003575 [Hypsizygus marmoreus]